MPMGLQNIVNYSRYTVP